MKANAEDDGATNDDPDFERSDDEMDRSRSSSSTDLDDTIQINPNYNGPSVDTDPDDHDSDDDSDGDDEEDDDECQDDVNGTKTTTPKNGTKVRLLATKSMLSKAMAKPKKALRTLRRHKTTIIVILVMYAFRRELAQFFYKLISAPVYGENGKIVGRSLTINPTSILKLLLFIQFMMRNLSLMSPADSDGMFASPDQSSSSSLFFGRFHKPYIHVPPTEQHWTFERINDRYEKDGLALLKAMGGGGAAGTSATTRHPNASSSSSTTTKPTTSSLPSMLRDAILHKGTHDMNRNTVELNNGTAIIMDLTKLSTTVTQMDWIRDQVSLILSQHQANRTRLETSSESMNNNNHEITATSTIATPQLEVIVLLESPGGGAADYGLAAHQLLRLRNEPGITLTICVDKVAASGGYMMAATGHTILAAPFAVIGSIGVYGQAINIHSVLEGWGVKDLIFRAGKNKAPLGLLGEVTQDGRDTIQTMIDATHRAFKYHIATSRPVLAPNIDDIATGDVWLGYDAVEIGLVDRLVTSDDYIGERMKQGTRVLKLVRYRKPSLLFGPRSSSTDYSVVGWGRSIVAELKQLLMGSVEDEVSDRITTRSVTANTVKAQSAVS